MKTLIIIIVIIVVVFLGFLLFQGGSDENPNNISEKTEVEEEEAGEKFDKAPSFSLQDINGDTVSLDDFKGKTLVLNSWAAWCPFCVDELPDFGKLQEEFGDEIVVIAINRQESLETSKAFSDKLGVTGDMIYLLDPKDSFYKSIGGFSMPETIFVDGDQNIIVHKRGPMKLDEMISKVNLTLGSN